MAASAPAARELDGEGVEVMLPVAPERLEPRIDLAKWRRVDRIEPARAFGAHGREAGLAQHAEVLGHTGLRDPEIGLDDVADRTGALLSIGEQLEDPPPDRVAQHVERMHALLMYPRLI